MDCQKLMYCIQQRPSLWDQTHMDYFNRANYKKMWSEISKEMEEETKDCKAYWRILRHFFFEEYAKVTGTAKTVVYIPKWKYYNNMKFLTTALIPNQEAPRLDTEPQSPRRLDDIKEEKIIELDNDDQ